MPVELVFFAFLKHYLNNKFTLHRIQSFLIRHSHTSERAPVTESYNPIVFLCPILLLLRFEKQLWIFVLTSCLQKLRLRGECSLIRIGIFRLEAAKQGVYFHVKLSLKKQIGLDAVDLADSGKGII